MVVWWTIFGALAGWLLSEFEGWGAVLGGSLGLLVGWTFRRAVRAEVARALAAAQDRFEARFDALAERAAQTLADAAPPAPTAPTPVASPARSVAVDSIWDMARAPGPVSPEPPAPAEPGMLAATLAHGVAAPRTGCSASAGRATRCSGAWWSRRAWRSCGRCSRCR